MGRTHRSVATGGPVRSTPTEQDNVLYFGSDDSKIYALDAATGATVWTVTTGGAVESSPTLQSNVLYVGSDDATVYALNPATGATLSTVTTGGPVAVRVGRLLRPISKVADRGRAAVPSS